MAIPITVPRLGWNMEEGVFVGWLKPDGAPVRAGEPLFSLESEKATEEVECLDDGILRIPPDGPRAGDKVAVGTVIGYLLQAGETAPSLPKDEGGRMKGEKDSFISPPSTAGRASRPAQARRAVSPRARRVAAELGIDWTRLQGSGRTGRIRECDVREASAKAQATTGPDAHAQGTGIAVSPIRRTIAERMLTSQRSTAPVTLTTTADATNLVNLRNQFKAASEAGTDLVPSYTDFLVKLTAVALEKHPLLNASWGGVQLRLSPGIHIGVAVDTAVGLLVPVLREVPSLSLRQLAARARDLSERAHQGKLTVDELQGGTFTVTNLGAFGIDAFTPIINFPQCAVLGVGRIQRRPVAVEDEIVARDQIGLSVTFDHRIVDGAPAARFVQTLTALLENPVPWLMP